MNAIKGGQLRDLRRTLKKVEFYGKSQGEKLIRYTANAFITSATVATNPVGKGKISGNSLPKPNRVRKKVTIGTNKQKSMGKTFIYNHYNGKIERYNKFVPTKRLKREGFERIVTFYEAINRKTGKKYYEPLAPGFSTNNNMARLIPNAGVTKAGWLAARGWLNLNGEKGLRTNTNRVNYSVQRKGIDPYILIVNKVKWIRKVSPNSARIGIANANKQLERIFIPKAEWEFKKIR